MTIDAGTSLKDSTINLRGNVQVLGGILGEAISDLSITLRDGATILGTNLYDDSRIAVCHDATRSSTSTLQYAQITMSHVLTPFLHAQLKVSV